jgi:hypothetical protein
MSTSNNIVTVKICKSHMPAARAVWDSPAFKKHQKHAELHTESNGTGKLFGTPESLFAAGELAAAASELGYPEAFSDRISDALERFIATADEATIDRVTAAVFPQEAAAA